MPDSTVDARPTLRWAVVGTGFVGSGVAAALRSGGVTPTLLHAPRLDLDPGYGLAQIMEMLDGRSFEELVDSLAADFAGHDVVVNAAGLAAPGAGASTLLSGANTLLPAVLYRAAVRAGVRRFVHVSSAAVQGRRRRLDETTATDPTSPYGSSKALGEELLLRVAARPGARTELTILRATSVQGPGRETSAQLAHVAASPLASVAGRGSWPTPVTTLEGLAAAVVHLGGTPARPPEIVLQPAEGRTAASVLREFGSREPWHLPTVLCRLLVRLGYAIARTLDRPAIAAQVRRVELMWFGQEQAVGWLADRATAAGQPPVGTPPTVLFAATAALTARVFMADQCTYLAGRGWTVHLVTADGPERVVTPDQRFRWHTLDMVRPIDPVRDLRSLAAWVKLLRQLRPRIVMCGTPKAGLLGTLAARITRCPTRVYLIRGLRAEGLSGAARAMSLASEWLACRSATHVVAVSPSLRDRIVRARLNAGRSVTVIGEGGSNGVDLSRFRPVGSEADRAGRAALRRSLGLEDKLVIGFVGRLTVGKGLADAVAAVLALNEHADIARLLVVGEFEAEHPIPSALRTQLDQLPVVRVGRVLDAAPYYRAMDIYLHLSHFEGLSNAVLEASATGLPVITTDATGGADAVRDGATGFVVPLGDAAATFDRLKRLAESPQLRAQMGAAGRAFVTASFGHDVVWANLHDYLTGLRAEA